MDPTRCAISRSAAGNEQAKAKLECAGVKIAQKVGVKDALERSSQILEGKRRRDVADAKVARLPLIARGHGHVANDSTDRIEAKQHVRLEEIPAIEFFQRQRRECSAMNRAVAVGRIHDVPVSASHLVDE